MGYWCRLGIEFLEGKMVSKNDDKQVSVLVDGLDHPEGLAWGLDGYLYAGGEAGQIYRINIESKDIDQFACTDGFVLGIALDLSNNIYACDLVNKCVQKITPDGVVSKYSAGALNSPFITPNYAVFDALGNLYVSDSGDWDLDNGSIYKVNPKGETHIWDTRIKEFPNGLCLSPDSDYLYLAMSLNVPRISRIKIKDDGSAGDIETLLELPGTVPDGLAFDIEGNLYIGCYRPDTIYKLDTLGHLDILAEDYQGTLMASPTNLAFCGKNLDRMFSANLGRWHITEYHKGLKGAPLHYPKLNG
tara:strand:- start:636 stop:1541 length:906 start_codon:yes stop_codon:yes gene_type:complete